MSQIAGKLDCYVAAAGFSPTRVLPIVVDVGTDNESLRNDPLYTGLKQDRICGQEYFEVRQTHSFARQPAASSECQVAR